MYKEATMSAAPDRMNTFNMLFTSATPGIQIFVCFEMIVAIVKQFLRLADKMNILVAMKSFFNESEMLVRTLLKFLYTYKLDPETLSVLAENAYCTILHRERHSDNWPETMVPIIGQHSGAQNLGQ